MLDIHFDSLQSVEAVVARIGACLGDHRRFWIDFVAPFTYGEIDDIFETDGRGAWAELDPLYAARKAVSYPGKDILRRSDDYFKAATTPSHANSFVEVGPTELVLGVSGLDYPAFHEEGTEDLSARPVYELIVAGERFEERMGQLGEKWTREEIAAAERRVSHG